MVKTGQIRLRNKNASQLATSLKIRIGEPHWLFENAYQLYDANSNRPCGGWNVSGIERDYSIILSEV